MNKPQPSSKKITKLTMLPDGQNPSEGDVQRLMKMAQGSPGNTFQLPWIHQKTGDLYTLSCTDSGVPEWTLTTGLAMHSTVVWTHLTGDLELINNLVWMEASGGLPPVAAPQPTSFADLSALVKSDMLKDANSRGLAAPEPIAAAPTAPAPMLEKSRTAAASSLQGNLKEMQVAGVLQSIQMTKMTGRLLVTDDDYAIEVYFEDGQPLHASSLQSHGDGAIMELLTWEEGSFQFIPMERTPERTISRRLEGILMEGAALVDQHQYLTKRGLHLGSYVLRKNASITEAQFEAALKDAAPIDMKAQKAIYQLVDHRRTLADILRARPLAKSQWVPIFYNLLSVNLLDLSDKPTLAAKHSSLEEIGVDQALVQAAYQSILRPESGMLNFPLFLYFLESEFNRFSLIYSPFSLLIFDVLVRKDKGVEPIAGAASKGLADLILPLKREIDLLGHFRTFEFGLVLPYTEATGALLFANRLVEVVRASTVGGAASSADVSIAIGVATIPQDGQTLGSLLAAAVEAKKVAREKQTPVVPFKSLYKA